MFSYFNGGIKNTKPTKEYDFEQLIDLIKYNGYQIMIEEVQNLRSNGDAIYKDLKKSLPYLTPNCTVSKRSLAGADFQKNFKRFSGYIYIDIDVPDAIEYKKYFIEKYGHLASLISLSCSHGGIAVLFEVQNEITKENYESIWYYIKDVILADEHVDINSKGIAQPWIVPYDPDVYYNLDNPISIDEKKCSDQGILWCSITTSRTSNTSIYNTRNNTLKCALSFVPIKEALKKVKTSTSIEVDNKIIDYYPVDFTSSRFPYKIKDGHKHRLYSVMLHRLFYLNKKLTLDYIYTYIHFINKHYADPVMEKEKLDNLFWFVYNCTQKDDYVFKHERIKWFHFNPDAGLTKHEKICLANELNGKRRSNDSIEKIKWTKKQLQATGKKITKKAVADITGMSRNTVIKYFDAETVDISQKVEDINDNYKPTSSYHNNSLLDTTGIAPEKRSHMEMTNTLPKSLHSPEFFKTELDKMFGRNKRG